MYTPIILFSFSLEKFTCKENGFREIFLKNRNYKKKRKKKKGGEEEEEEEKEEEEEEEEE